MSNQEPTAKGKKQQSFHSTRLNCWQNKTVSAGGRQAGKSSFPLKMRLRRVNCLECELADFRNSRSGWLPCLGRILGPFGHYTALIVPYRKRVAGRDAGGAGYSPVPACAQAGLVGRVQTVAVGTAHWPSFSYVDFPLPQPLGRHPDDPPACGSSGAGSAQSHSVLLDGRNGAGQRSKIVHFTAGQWVDTGGWLPAPGAERGCRCLLPVPATAES